MGTIAEAHSNLSMQHEFYERGQSRLRDHGYKMTPQRDAILNLFAQHFEHHTPQEIFSLLEGKVRSLSLATVYNSLEIFEKVGIVSKICSGTGQTYFDPNTSHHHHAVCSKCGTIIDLDVPQTALDEFLAQVQSASEHSQRSFVVQAATVWLNGECATCHGVSAS